METKLAIFNSKLLQQMTFSTNYVYIYGGLMAVMLNRFDNYLKQYSEMICSYKDEE